MKFLQLHEYEFFSYLFFFKEKKGEKKEAKMSIYGDKFIVWPIQKTSITVLQKRSHKS